MKNPIQQHFGELDDQLKAHFQLGISELHGMSSALVCCGRQKFDSTDWVALVGIGIATQQGATVLEGIFELANKGLRADEGGLTLLLPGDDESVPVRTEALADWCNGFIQVWATLTPKSKSTTVTEAIEDIQAISEVETPGDNSESQRFALFELEEFVKVAVQLIYDDIDSNPSTSTPGIK